MKIEDFKGFVNEFELVDPIKVDRVLNGTTNNRGEITPGIMKNGQFDEAELLAEYDRIAGFIRLNGSKVKTGSFYDFKNRKPLAEPKVMLTFKVNGKFVDVSADEDLPPLVKAAKLLEEAENEEYEEEEEEEEKPKKRGKRSK